MSRSTPVPISATQDAWLLVLAAATVLPHLPFAPSWLVLAAALLLGARALLWWRRLPLPPGWLLTLLVLVAGLAVFLTFQRLFGRDPGIALLLCLCCLKPFESRKVRDGLTLVFLCWFLQLGLFFYNQGMATAALAGVNLLLSTATLSALCHPSRPPLGILRLSGRMLLQAAPLMLVLFLLFPRIQGPLWGLPLDAYKAESGLSDSMSPGSIAQLSLSDAIAFRVKFDAAPPPQGRLYWRGPVLSHFDGRTWRPAASHATHALPYPTQPHPPTAGYFGTRLLWNPTIAAGCSPWNFPSVCPLMA